MVFIDETFAVADCSVGTDIFAKKEYQKSSFNRLIRGFACVGANAALEASVELKINKEIVATIRNEATGLVVETHTDWRPISSLRMIPAGSELQAIVKSAPTVSPMRIVLDLAEV